MAFGFLKQKLNAYISVMRENFIMIQAWNLKGKKSLF